MVPVRQRSGSQSGLLFSLIHSEPEKHKLKCFHSFFLLSHFIHLWCSTRRTRYDTEEPTISNKHWQRWLWTLLVVVLHLSFWIFVILSFMYILVMLGLFWMFCISLIIFLISLSTLCISFRSICVFFSGFCCLSLFHISLGSVNVSVTSFCSYFFVAWRSFWVPVVILHTLYVL